MENCLGKLNPSSKLSMMGKCTGDSCIGNILYDWSIYIKNGTLPNGQIYWILDAYVMKQVEVYRKSLTFVVKKDLLQPDKVYKFKLEGGRLGGSKGLAQRNAITNSPPNGGYCSADTTVGEALETEFMFWCEKWDDEDVPLRYEFVYLNEVGSESLFYFGVDTMARTKLPLGIDKDNFTLVIQFRVIDAFGATAKTTLRVKVRHFLYDSTKHL